MALDPSIILQAGKGVTPLLNPTEIQDQQMQRELGGMKLAQLRQGMQDDQTMRGIAQNTAPEGLAGAYYKAGLIKPAQDAQKFQTEQQKAAADARKTQVDTGKTMQEAMGGPLKWLSENPSMENAAATLKHLNEAGIMAPAQVSSALQQLQSDPSPEGIKKFAMLGYSAAISADKRMTDDTQRRAQDMTQQNSLATNATSAANNANTVGASRANNADTIAAANVRAKEGNAAGRVPAGYRLAADGLSLEFIPGGPADPSAAKKAAPTEFQGKSAGFGARAQESDRILNEIAGDYSPAGINTKNALGNTPLIGGALEATANAALSDNSQKAEQAQRDFMNALLRQESGAAIGKDEFSSGKRQYFPQPGDSAAVIEQKAANRRLAVQGLLNNAGNATVATPQSAAQLKQSSGALTVTDAASYAKVPSGATYTTPDGKTRRKP